MLRVNTQILKKRPKGKSIQVKIDNISLVFLIPLNHKLKNLIKDVRIFSARAPSL